MARLPKKSRNVAGRSTVQGYLFSPLRFRRTPISFSCDSSRDAEPQVKVEETFSKIHPSRLHECTVIVNSAMFLVTAYWANQAHPNLAIKTVCRGLEWRGELAIVQVGRITPYYKRVKNPRSVNKAVSRFITEFRRRRDMLEPIPTLVDASD